MSGDEGRLYRPVRGDADVAWEIAKVFPEIGRPAHVPVMPHAEPPKVDAVVRPSHYTRFVIEPITFIMANGIGYAAGNVIKYVMRWDAKDGLQDLKKARQYLDIMIADAERKAAE